MGNEEWANWNNINALKIVPSNNNYLDPQNGLQNPNEKNRKKTENSFRDKVEQLKERKQREKR